ncbi:MAG: head maturation protease, ClpP-related [Gemmatimonadales bacterium]
MRPYIVASTSEAGDRTLELSLYGVLDGDLLDESSVSTAELVAQIRASAAREISVRINSVGGSLFGGIALYNALVEHRGDVTCTVEGLAASAASLVAMAGRTVMGKGAMMMIHNPQGATVGDANAHRKTADVLDQARESIVPIYTSKTGKSNAAIKALLDAETWMTADEAKSQRFADAVEGSDKPVVSMRGELVVVAGVAFPRARVPRQLVTPPTPAELEEAKAIAGVAAAAIAYRARGI